MMTARERILQRWTETFLSRYPIRPVVEIVEYIEEATSKILDGVLKLYSGNVEVNIDEALDDLMRFLATDRNLTPGESIKLIANLKHIIAEEMGLSEKDSLRLFNIMDKILYKAFDFYMACREEIFNLRLKEKERDLEIMRRVIEFAKKTDFKF